MKDLVKALTDKNEKLAAESMAMIERFSSVIEDQAREIEVLREYRSAIRNYNDCHGIEGVTLDEAVEIERRAEARLEAAEKACHDFYAGRAHLNQSASGGDDAERAAFEAAIAAVNENGWTTSTDLARQIWRHARAALPVREAVADGWQLVPVDSTGAMEDAAGIGMEKAREVYRAMLAAAPSPSREGE